MLFNVGKLVMLDGAMGTMLQKAGVNLGKVPEDINIKSPETVVDIHRQYIESGSDIIYANTFGVNRYKAAGSEYTVEELIAAGVKNARKAADGTDVKIALSVGPVGTLLEPNGTLSFDEAYDIFKEVVLAGEKSGADLVVFETVADLLEMKAAVLAAKENTSLPVVSTMTFEEDGRTFTGVSVPAMAVTLEGLGVDAVGMNCSLGPAEMIPLVKQLLEYTDLPVVVKANAGLPNLNSNTYDISADEFSDIMVKYAEMGVSVAGGCCGTTPEYIKLMKKKLSECVIGERSRVPKPVLCSGSRHVVVDGVRIVGERINPTGKKRFKEALKSRDMGYILTQAIEQVRAGASILDVNVGLPEIDEVEMMETVIKELQSVSDVPLQIDSSDPAAIERALRIYNGKAIVNSVNGDEEVLEKILPIVKKYGAAVIGLTLDKNGIPETAGERFKIAERIVNAAEHAGIKREDIYIDCLTLTVSAQQKEAAETLRALKMTKERLGVKTVLGVSNISFGLPDRELINSTFLTLALAHGLDLPIINPNIKSMTDAVDAFNVLYNRDAGASEYISRHSGDVRKEAAKPKGAEPEMTLGEAVRSGVKEKAREAAQKLVGTMSPLDMINDIMIPALDRVGAEFEKGTLFLPQLMQAATAAQAAFEVIKQVIAADSPDGGSISKDTIVIATVKGDIHDIGKNIVKVILENYGFNVIDLGRDVPAEKVVDAAIKYNAGIVGLSALMTTTVSSMKETIEALHSAGVKAKIMVGGAVLTEEYAMSIGADYYAKDAKQSADIAKHVFEYNENGVSE